MNIKWHFNNNTPVWKRKHTHVLHSNIYTTFVIDNIFKGSCTNIKSCVGGKNGLKKMNGVCLPQPAVLCLVQADCLERRPSLS